MPSLPHLIFNLALLCLLTCGGGGIVWAQTAPEKQALDRRLSALEAKNPADERNFALFAFKLEQGRLWKIALDRLAGWEPVEYLTAYERTLDRASALTRGLGDMAPVAGSNFHERAYIAANDNSAQPYWVAVPPGYTPRKKYPLLVFLHGYTPEISKINPWIPSLEMIEAAQKRGFIMAIPYGRRNTDFVQVGQDDLLQVRAEVEKLYSVDPERVHLIGASMGGYGTWAAGLHTAGKWAALAPICGRTDFYLWFRLQRDLVEPWKRLLYDADDPRFLATNTHSTPVLMQHGALDYVVSPEHSRRMAEDARRLQLPVLYREHADGDHYQEFQQAAFERALNWLLGQKRSAPPRKFSLVTGDLKEASAHWASVQAFEDYQRAATLQVELQPDNQLVVQLENVAAFTLEPPPSYLKKGVPVHLTVNGVAVPAESNRTGTLSWHKARAALQKKPGRSGPFKNAFRDPFLLVYGDPADQASAERFRMEWWNYADGWPAIKAAADVTETDKAQYNLVLFGTGTSNPLLQAISPALPMEITPTGYRMGQKQVARPNVGLRMVWKSPWSAERVIVVQSGLWWGERLPPNHLWDLIPDYIIYNSELDPSDDTQKAIEAGYFDGNWELPAAPPAQAQTMDSVPATALVQQP